MCTVAFAAAAIAEAHPWKTGFLAFRFGLFVYLLPLAFLFGGLLDFGDPLQLVRAVVTVMLAAYAFSGAVVGYRAGPLAPWQRGVLLVATGVFFHPDLVTDAVGIALMVLVLGVQFATKRGILKGAERVQGD